MEVLHISPHVGGGVGSVIGGFFKESRDRNITNSLFCLDWCNTNFNDISSTQSKFEGVLFRPQLKELLVKRVNQVDVVLLHYWNHPLLAKLLSENVLTKDRLVIWCHNSGLFEPHVLPKYLVSISSKVIFSSSCSYAANNLQSLISEFPTAFGCVHSTRNTDQFLDVAVTRVYKYPLRNLLYVGTVSGSKMHPRSAEIFSDLSKKGFLITVVGGPGHEKLAEEVRSLGGEIEIYGEVADVGLFYRNADLFIYPLRSDHYGTGEQVILEAMASGLPVVAFDNPAERAILQEGGGILASSVQDFGSNVVRLSFESLDIIEKMSKTAIDRIRSEFDVSRMVNQLVDVMLEVSEVEHLKIVDCSTDSQSSNEIDELALYVLHSFFDGEDIVRENRDNLSLLHNVIYDKIRLLLESRGAAERWYGFNKSTPFHYQRFFPENIHLTSLCERLMLDA